MLPMAPDLPAILRLAYSSGGFVHSLAQCPFCPHLAHMVREYSFRLEKRLGAQVFGRRF